MKKRNILKSEYGAFGFAEALIAIAVTGIAATVLMSISASSMRQLMQIEDRDKMAQLARSGAVLVQQIADDDATSVEFAALALGGCYKLDTIEAFVSPFSIVDQELNTPDERNAVRLSNEEDDDFLRIMCIESDVANGRRIVKIITGLVNSRGEVTNSTDTKDYEYISVINL